MIIWRKRSKVRNRCETEGIAASQMRDQLPASDMADFAGQMRKWEVRAFESERFGSPSLRAPDS